MMISLSKKAPGKSPRDAVTIASNAKALMSMMALLLVLPVALISIQNPKKLEVFHNRTLNAWPQSARFMKNPVDYFGAVKAWIADRAFPIAELSRASKVFLFDVFNISPEKRVAIGSNGFIFLSGSSEKNLYDLFEDACVRAHHPAMAKLMKVELQSLAAYAAKQHIKVDVVILPMLATIYAEYLPDSVPRRYRATCAEPAQGRSTLLTLAQESNGRLTYPLPELYAAREDEALFPKANWHPNGLSLLIARDAYLSAQHLATPMEEKIALGVARSEILSSYGITRTFPIYAVWDSELREDPASAVRLVELSKDLFLAPQIETKAYVSKAPPNEETVLMLSDSYGTLASTVFASAFRRLLQVNTNNMGPAKAPTLVERVRKTEKIDRIILLVQEGGTDRVVNWGRAFGAVSE